MSGGEFHHYNPDEFYPNPDDKAAIAAGIESLRAEQRAFRLAEMRRHPPGPRVGHRARQARHRRTAHPRPPTSSMLFSPIRIFSKGK